MATMKSMCGTATPSLTSRRMKEVMENLHGAPMDDWRLPPSAMTIGTSTSGMAQSSLTFHRLRAGMDHHCGGHHKGTYDDETATSLGSDPDAGTGVAG